MTDPKELQESFLNDIERQLIGPADGDTEVILGKPWWRYVGGILYPSSDTALRQDADGELNTSSGDESDPAVSAAYDRLPSSMGLSFLVSGAEALEIQVEAAKYSPKKPDDQESANKKDQWQRTPLPSESGLIQVPVSRAHQSVHQIFDGAARVVVVFRPTDQGYLTTVTLVNEQVPTKASSKAATQASLYQCRFNVRPIGGSVVPYPSATIGFKHPEDEELDFIYQARKSFGVGHGCAASWNLQEGLAGTVSNISAEPMPRVEVQGATNKARPEEEGDEVFDIGWLADEKVPAEDLKSSLTKFVNRYEAWVCDQEENAERGEQPEVARRIVEKQKVAVAKMRKGVDHLTSSSDPTPRRAFRLAQLAILGQFSWNNQRGDEPCDVGDARTEAGDGWVQKPPTGSHRWRPFQLAFQLAVLESVSNVKSEDRELADLLWFPTGGGKTEAYLAIAAFEMFRRRLEYGDSGTAVLMRYTLRLLTSQQFERCAGLISAMEVIRRSMNDLGQDPFRLGLWVGGSLSPNRLTSDNERALGAVERLADLLEESLPENPFLLTACPRCGTRIVPERKSPREAYGVEVSNTHFRLHCPDRKCTLHEEIPVSMVDDDLFQNPPTFVIGTIDKFAQLAWDARPRAMFGSLNTDKLPPSLIIQDELHLINGPLGTIAGCYEAGLETVIREAGIVPKYLAATATIHRAEDQCRALYGRSASVFPPAGLDVDDAYFSRKDTASPGRTYIGVMSQGPYSILTSWVSVSAAAASAAAAVAPPGHTNRDSYWTQVIYHNSKRELGKTTTMVRDDVDKRLKVLEKDKRKEDKRLFESIEELSANLKGADVTQALERLQVSYPDESVVDMVACTNMLSVGIDVGRLGLMIMKSQPKTTAEYIQATSRVGRDTKRPPGIVITVYSPNRPRDRSHFEDFQAYHTALYRAVEPSSVTPFAEPARRRTLHAALVLALRQLMGWKEGRDAGKFDPQDGEQSSIIETLRRRIKDACRPGEESEALNHFDELIEQWCNRKDYADRVGKPLTFDALPQFVALLDKMPECPADGLWPTLNNMRHVDGETPFMVKGGN